MSEQAEAYVRKKPKRIIHNQALIIALMCLTVVGGAPLGVFIFWLTFGIYPSFTVPLIMILWAVSAITYMSLRIYFKVKGEK